MAEKSPLTQESFVRDLPFTLRTWLASRLDVQDTWESLAAAIPSNHEDLLSSHPSPFQARYETHDMFLFRKKRSPTLSFLEDWEIDNCQTKHLIQALFNASLIDAAKHILNECTQQPPQQQGVNVRPHQQTPDDAGAREAVLSVNGGVVGNSLKAANPQPLIEVERLQENGYVTDKSPSTKPADPSHNDVQQVHHFTYELLRNITGNFDIREKAEGGNLIGSGGFGHVFFGEFFCNKLAVKRLNDNKDESLKQFETELKTLCTYKHENLVTLLGYCSDGISPCLVYEYVVNGSLEDRLACLHGSPPLSVACRLDIVGGTAKGIDYLHDLGVTHRDIKSANILLDEDFTPKVGDFATARAMTTSSSNGVQTYNKTQVIIGTTAYLDPEAHDHMIHPGLDVYSFGVIILEIITGLPVSDNSREEEDLKIHVREHCTPCVASDDDDDDDSDEEDAVDGTIFDLVDKRPGLVWKPAVVEELYTLSNQCLERRRRRKDIKQVLDTLDALKELYADGEDTPEK